MSHRFHKNWLWFTACAVAVFGPVFSLGTVAETLEGARLTMDLLDWPVDGATTFEAQDTRFLSALTGGFLFGWGVMIGCMAFWLYDLSPEGVRKSVLTGLLAWFCLDSAGSIASGTASNAGWNIAVLLTLVGPLWRPARG
jgi:hypothetical protein